MLYIARRLLIRKEKNQILHHVHCQVTDHNPWYLLIGPSIVYNPKPIFYHPVVTICLRNMFVWIFRINFYSHIITHFTHNWLKLAVVFNEFNGKSFFVVMSCYYTQIPVALLFFSIVKWYQSYKLYVFVNFCEQRLFIDEHNANAKYQLLIIINQFYCYLNKTIHNYFWPLSCCSSLKVRHIRTKDILRYLNILNDDW